MKSIRVFLFRVPHMLFPASTWPMFGAKEPPKDQWSPCWNTWDFTCSSRISEDWRDTQKLLMRNDRTLFLNIFTVPKSHLKQPKHRNTSFLGEAWKSQVLRDEINRPSFGTEVMSWHVSYWSVTQVILAKAYWELLDTPTKYQLPIHLTCHKDLWTLLPASSHCKGACASACTLSSPSSSSLNKFAGRNDQHTNPCGAPNSYKVATKCVNAFQNSSQIKMDLGSCILASYHI